MNAASELTGKAVFSSDGADIGRIKDVRGDFFAVDVRLQPDYWLSNQYIARNVDVVMLSLPKGEIDEHKLDAPPLDLAGVADPAARDGIISSEQMLSQRERMERELAEQNRKLHA